MHASATPHPFLLSLRAILAGLFIAILAANVWPLLVIRLSVPFAAATEVLFLAILLWWAGGGGPPRSWQAARMRAFRGIRLSPRQWIWGILAAVAFAVTVHAALVLLFRVIPFSPSAFRRGYDLSFIPKLSLRWIAVVVSAAAAAISEETGFRGYIQQPIEEMSGVPIAVGVSALFFTLLHLNQAWATPAMLPIVLGAGVLLGFIAAAARSLIPGMIGHFLMDLGLFAYWWTGLAGTFSARPVSETGVDAPFLIACVVFTAGVACLVTAISKLRKAH